MTKHCIRICTVALSFLLWMKCSIRRGMQRRGMPNRSKPRMRCVLCAGVCCVDLGWQRRQEQRTGQVAFPYKLCHFLAAEWLHLDQQTAQRSPVTADCAMEGCIDARRRSVIRKAYKRCCARSDDIPATLLYIALRWKTQKLEW